MSLFSQKTISGTYSLTSTDKALYEPISDSALRIQFAKSENSVTPFVSAKFCVLTVEGIKVLAGVFIDASGTESTLVQIPLVGQPISELVRSLNTYVEVFAESVNSFDYLSSMLLKDTAFTTVSGTWAYFSAETTNINSTFSTLSTDITYHLTSAEPVSLQNNYTQSLGGYVSTNELYRGAELLSSVSIYDKILYLGQSVSDGFSIVDLQKSEYVQIGEEIIRISKWSSNAGYIAERNAFNTPLRSHSKGSIVREILKNDFFDLNFSPERKQYRCIAIKNEHANDIAKDMKVFFKINSRNNLSTIRLAIEAPNSDYYSGTSSSTGITAFSVTNLAGVYQDSHFVAAPIVFTSGSNSGQKRLVKSFTASSGTIEIDERLPNSISIGDQFYIDTAPSHRTKSGMKAPSGSNVSEFFDANNETTAVSINVLNNRASGKDLKPNEVIYVWIERVISESNDEFLNNRFSLSVIYSKV